VLYGGLHRRLGWGPLKRRRRGRFRVRGGLAFGGSIGFCRSQSPELYTPQSYERLIAWRKQGNGDDARVVNLSYDIDIRIRANKNAILGLCEDEEIGLRPSISETREIRE